MKTLRVSKNSRFLETVDGVPFFWLGDTAWELFHRLNREDALCYLDDRAAKGFTVIQAVALAERNGLEDPNPYGHCPLIDHNPSTPNLKEGADYWDHVDFIVTEANRRGMRIGFLPTWGNLWDDDLGGTGIFTEENAEVYGEWLGRRYQTAGLIWILGGDHPIRTDSHKAVLVAMARGLRRGDAGEHLITFHPYGGESSAPYFHSEEWLDLNMLQTGHITRFSGCREEYNLTPVKPVIDGEPLYEGIPISFKSEEFGHSLACDVRRALYWNLFSGACGHTYGHNSIWQMFTLDREPQCDPLMPWQEALHQPGAEQMQFGRRLLESRSFGSHVPDDSILVPDVAIPGADRYRLVAMRDDAGRYAMVYAPVGRKFTVCMKVISGERVVGWWFNPRDGSAQRIGIFQNEGFQTFCPPDAGEMLDWVLVLDDASSFSKPPSIASPS